MDIGFLILCPDKNVQGLRITLASIRNRSYNRDAICVVGNNIASKELKEIKEICEVYKGDDTITSLLNEGIKKSSHEWVCILFSGSRIPFSLERKLEQFCKAESDVLFPVVNRIWNFVDGSSNGILINRKFFEKVGDFPTMTIDKEGINDFEFAKLLWALEALKFGCTFKAIIGTKVA